jgi:hypothetical protein
VVLLVLDLVVVLLVLDLVVVVFVLLDLVALNFLMKNLIESMVSNEMKNHFRDH